MNGKSQDTLVSIQYALSFSLNEEISTNYCVGVCPNCCVITLALLRSRSRSPNAGCLWLSAAGGNSFIARLFTLGTCSVPVGSQYAATLYFVHCA